MHRREHPTHPASAVGRGFEPRRGFPLLPFQDSALGHYAIPPGTAWTARESNPPCAPRTPSLAARETGPTRGGRRLVNPVSAEGGVSKPIPSRGRTG